MRSASGHLYAGTQRRGWGKLGIYSQTCSQHTGYSRAVHSSTILTHTDLGVGRVSAELPRVDGWHCQKQLTFWEMFAYSFLSAGLPQPGN